MNKLKVKSIKLEFKSLDGTSSSEHGYFLARKFLVLGPVGLASLLGRSIRLGFTNFHD